MRRIIFWLRGHPEALVFLVGSLLFAGGLMTVIKRQLSPDPAQVAGRAFGSASQKQGRVGPQRDEELKPYIERKKSVLAARASKEPRKSSFAIVVFDSYRKASEVADSLAGESVRPVSVQMRIPLPRFEAQEVSLENKSIPQAAGEFAGPAHIQQLTEEMVELQSVASDVDDPAFKEVYLEDSQTRQKAIELLKKGGGTIFSVVVRGSHAALARIASRTGVRLVDVPDDPAATPATFEFAGIFPEDTATARFAVE